MMQTAIFEDLQSKIDEDTAIKDVGHLLMLCDALLTSGQKLRDIVSTLEKQGKNTRNAN